LRSKRVASSSNRARARFQNRGPDRHVGFGLPDALVDRSRRVPDLQPHVPQAVKDRFRDRFAPGSLLVGKDKQQIDVGARRQQAAAIAAGRDHRHPFGLRRIVGRVEVFAGKLEQDADNLVLHCTKPLGAAAALALLEQELLGLLAPARQFALHVLGDRAL
jgi:hypothetical protein